MPLKHCAALRSDRAADLSGNGNCPPYGIYTADDKQVTEKEVINSMTEEINSLQEKIGYRFRDTRLLVQALSHSSYANEHKHGVRKDNERLEFLGDAVLELSSSEYIYLHYPKMPEGDMTKLRAALVCEQALSSCARKIGLPDYLRLGKGEEVTGGRQRDSIISDAMEAVIGAIYLDGGFEAAKAYVFRFIMTDIEHRKLFYDSKTVLQELIQSQAGSGMIHYELVGEEGPDHAKRFISEVYVGDTCLGRGSGTTKKGAQMEAAYRAILKMRGDTACI